MSLKNKVAVVTGGNTGIGQAIALELARQSASIVIDYVAHPESTNALEQQIAKLGSQSIGVPADVSKLADLQKLRHGDERQPQERLFRYANRSHVRGLSLVPGGLSFAKDQAKMTTFHNVLGSCVFPLQAACAILARKRW